MAMYNTTSICTIVIIHNKYLVLSPAHFWLPFLTEQEAVWCFKSKTWHSSSLAFLPISLSERAKVINIIVVRNCIVVVNISSIKISTSYCRAVDIPRLEAKCVALDLVNDAIKQACLNRGYAPAMSYYNNTL